MSSTAAVIYCFAPRRAHARVPRVRTLVRRERGCGPETSAAPTGHLLRRAPQAPAVQARESAAGASGEQPRRPAPATRGPTCSFRLELGVFGEELLAQPLD